MVFGVEGLGEGEVKQGFVDRFGWFCPLGTRRSGAKLPGHSAPELRRCDRASEGDGRGRRKT